MVGDKNASGRLFDCHQTLWVVQIGKLVFEPCTEEKGQISSKWFFDSTVQLLPNFTDSDWQWLLKSSSLGSNRCIRKSEIYTIYLYFFWLVESHLCPLLSLLPCCRISSFGWALFRGYEGGCPWSHECEYSCSFIAVVAVWVSSEETKYLHSSEVFTGQDRYKLLMLPTLDSFDNETLSISLPFDFRTSWRWKYLLLFNSYFYKHIHRSWVSCRQSDTKLR